MSRDADKLHKLLMESYKEREQLLDTANRLFKELEATQAALAKLLRNEFESWASAAAILQAQMRRNRDAIAKAREG